MSVENVDQETTRVIAEALHRRAHAHAVEQLRQAKGPTIVGSGTKHVSDVYIGGVTIILPHVLEVDFHNLDGKKLRFQASIWGALCPLTGTLTGKCGLYYSADELLDPNFGEVGIGVAQLGLLGGFGGIVVTFYKNGVWFGDASAFGLVGIGGGGGTGSFQPLT